MAGQTSLYIPQTRKEPSEMIFKTPNSFPVYTVGVRPGKAAAPYLGGSQVTFDHYPDMEEVLEVLAEQEKAYNKSVRQHNMEGFYGKKGMARKRRFRQQGRLLKFLSRRRSTAERSWRYWIRGRQRHRQVRTRKEYRRCSEGIWSRPPARKEACR